MFAVDPVLPVAQEAAEWGAQLLVVHHPLFLKGVHGVARTTPKGRTLGVLQDAGCALLTAHTNADQAVGGVSEALATTLGLTDLQPITAVGNREPRQADDLRPGGGRRQGAPGAGRGGGGGDRRLRHRVVLDPGRGPVPAARRARTPPSARSGRSRSSTRCGSSACWRARPGPGRRGDAGGAPLRGAGVRRRRARRSRYGGDRQRPDRHGRGDHARGLRAAGGRARCPRRRTASGWAAIPTRVVRRVAVCGGAGDFLLDAVRRTDADVYVTSDLRHHPASEFLEQGGPALVDVAHWAAEWTWLPVVAAKVSEALGDTVETRVSTLCTDPWTEPHRRRALKADPAAQLALLDLQELDARADLLRHQRETLPELAEIAALHGHPCRARRQAAGRADLGRRPHRRAEPRSTPTSSRSRRGARATRTGWTRG